MFGAYILISSPHPPGANELTHWGRVTHICVSKLTIIGSENGLSPSRRQAIIWTNAGILSIRPSGTNFSETWIKINVFSFKKMHLKMSYGKWRPCCLGLNELTPLHHYLLLLMFGFRMPLYSTWMSCHTSNWHAIGDAAANCIGKVACQDSRNNGIKSWMALWLIPGVLAWQDFL